MKPFIAIFVSATLTFCSCESRKAVSIPKTPNIVLIVADDLGYSDLGCFGSEIATPNIDALAGQGRIFTGFYTAATCSPTRAMLLTGTDNHIAGLGNMAERAAYIDTQRGQPGYEGYLNSRVISVAQLLKDAGYHTYMAGKWHLGLTPDQSPKARGFEKSFALMEAYANHYAPDPGNSFWETDQFSNFPNGHYSTDVYTDKLIGFLKTDQKDKNPFFLYAAYTSPHWPLQAPPEYIAKYQGVYDIGYDSLRTLRQEGLKRKGIIDANANLPERPMVEGNLYDISERPLRAWQSLTQQEKKIEARKMEIYAGMINNLDGNIGRLINHLKEAGKYDNTLFVFMSDNGAAVMTLNATPDDTNPIPYMGTVNSFVAYGPPWAHASSAVNSYYKGYSAEGGIHCPLIVKLPLQSQGYAPTSAFTSVMDLAPTFLDLAGLTYPLTYDRHSVNPQQGTSMLPFLNGKTEFVHDAEYVMGWELFGRCALRKGKWKISKIEPPFGKGVFQLFDISEDPSESQDLAAKFPNKYQEMLKHWEEYVRDNGVILLK